MVLRILVFAFIIGAVYFGVRRIARDWRDRFRHEDEQARQRDLKEREKPGVIDLSPGDDGVFRPKDED